MIAIRVCAAIPYRWVPLQRKGAIGVPRGQHQAIEIGHEAFFAGRLAQPELALMSCNVPL